MLFQMKDKAALKGVWPELAREFNLIRLWKEALLLLILILKAHWEDKIQHQLKYWIGSILSRENSPVTLVIRLPWWRLVFRADRTSFYLVVTQFRRMLSRKKLMKRIRKKNGKKLRRLSGRINMYSLNLVSKHLKQ